MKVTIDDIKLAVAELNNYPTWKGILLLKKIQLSDVVETAGVNKHSLYVNPKFVEENIKNVKQLTSLIAHELMHLTLRHTLLDAEDFSSGFMAFNWALDCIVNSVLKRLGLADLPIAFYPKNKELEGFLNPDNPALKNNPLYMKIQNLTVTIKELVEFFEKNNTNSPRLLGTHKPNYSISKELAEDAMGEVIEKGGISKDNKVFKQHLFLKKVKLPKNIVEAVIKIFKPVDNSITSSVVPPKRLFKKDLFLLSQNSVPVLWRCRKLDGVVKLLLIYLDVSYSIDFKSIYSIVYNLNNFYQIKLFQFSDDVYDISENDLKNNIIKTTGGTTDCFLKHFMDNCELFKKKFGTVDVKALVITDGEVIINVPFDPKKYKLYVMYIGGGDNEDLSKLARKIFYVDV